MTSWAMTYPNEDSAPGSQLDQVLWECFRHFANRDESNAATHLGQTRYSPLTFQLAEHLHAMDVYDDLAPTGAALLAEVVRHRGTYEHDKGR